MSEFWAETLTAPLTAARGPVGQSSVWARALAALTLGSAGSSVAAWLLAGRGAGNLAGLAAMAGGRLLLDAALWLVAAALLGAAEAALPGASGGDDGPGDTSPRSRSWHLCLAVAAAQRVWLAPAAALAKLGGVLYLGRLARFGVWLWLVALVYLMARERGHGGARALQLLAVGLVLPLALAVGGLLLAGLGWLLTPLWPGGVTPFVPL
jgi:hypothetical protein